MIRKSPSIIPEPTVHVHVELREDKKITGEHLEMESTSGGDGWILNPQFLRDLPGKDAVPKVPISCGVLIDGLLQVQIPETEN